MPLVKTLMAVSLVLVNSGFVGDGLRCNDVDEGAEGRNCDQNGLSSNTPGSFRMTHSNARVKTGLVAME